MSFENDQGWDYWLEGAYEERTERDYEQEVRDLEIMCGGDDD